MKTAHILATLTCSALAAFSQSTIAGPADLDPTFGLTGTVMTAFTGATSTCLANSVAVQTDGKILTAGAATIGGSVDFGLIRYNPDGTLDTSFNGTGMVTTDFNGADDLATCLAVQTDGKIVVAGRSANRSDGFWHWVVVRYNADGSLDTGFGSGGKVITAIGYQGLAFSVALQSDGKIVVAGNTLTLNDPNDRWDFAVVRYLTDGSLDTSFGGTGKVITGFGGTSHGCNSVAVQSDGKIVAVGSDSSSGPTSGIALARYNSDGSLDTTFNGTGKVTTNYVSGDNVALRSDGKIVVTGISRSAPYQIRNFAVVRYNADGSLDTSFGGTGKVTTDIGGFDDDGKNSVALLANGKILVAGTSQIAGNPNRDFVLVRYNADGSLDNDFNGTGKVTTDIGSGSSDVGNSVTLQNNGKIVLAGWSNFGGGYPKFTVARYGTIDTDGDGIIDEFETGTGIYISPRNTGTSPTNPDTDGDGLNDGAEVNTHHSNPNLPDTDADGFSDGFEVSTGFSPTDPVSTPDAVSAIDPAVRYRFNAANGVSYRIEVSTDLANWSTLETPIIGTGGVVTRLYPIEGQAKRFFRSRRN